MTLVVSPRWPPVQNSDVQRVYVVGFDPGETTGWATLRLHLGKLLSVGFAEMALHGAGDPDVFAWDVGTFRDSENNMADQMVGLLRGVWVDGVFDEGGESDLLAVTVEDFILRKFSSDRALLSPVRVTAAFNYARREVPIPVTRFSSSDSMSVVTDQRLRRLNLYVPVDHQRDALRQAVLLARKMTEELFRERWVAGCPWMRER